MSDMLAGVDPGTLPTAWTPESQTTGCLGCSAFSNGAVERRQEIQRSTESRCEPGARLSAPGHSRMTEGSRCREPL